MTRNRFYLWLLGILALIGMISYLPNGTEILGVLSSLLFLIMLPLYSANSTVRKLIITPHGKRWFLRVAMIVLFSSFAGGWLVIECWHIVLQLTPTEQRSPEVFVPLLLLEIGGTILIMNLAQIANYHLLKRKISATT